MGRLLYPMTPLALALAMLAQPQCHANVLEAPILAAHILRAEERYGLPTGLLAAVVLHESSGKWIVSRRRHDGGRDHGYAQIHMGPASRPVHNPRTMAGNILEGARLLARSRKICTQHPGWRVCLRGEYATYNARSPRWWSRVEKIWMRLCPIQNS
jgi:hypothetical protein